MRTGGCGASLHGLCRGRPLSLQPWCARPEQSQTCLPPRPATMSSLTLPLPTSTSGACQVQPAAAVCSPANRECGVFVSYPWNSEAVCPMVVSSATQVTQASASAFSALHAARCEALRLPAGEDPDFAQQYLRSMASKAGVEVQLHVYDSKQASVVTDVRGVQYRQLKSAILETLAPPSVEPAVQPVCACMRDPLRPHRQQFCQHVPVMSI